MKNTEKKGNLLEKVAELVDKNIQTEDIQEYVDAREILGNHNLSELVNLSTAITRNGLSPPVAIKDLAALRASNHTIREVLHYSKNQQYFEAQGFTQTAQLKLCEISKKYGGIETVLSQYYLCLGIHELQEIIRLSNDIVAEREALIQELKTEWKAEENVINGLRFLFINGYNLDTIITLWKVVEKYGAFDQILEAINTYVGFVQLKDEVTQLSIFKDELVLYVNHLLNIGLGKVAALENAKKLLQSQLTELNLQPTQQIPQKDKAIIEENMDPDTNLEPELLNEETVSL